MISEITRERYLQFQRLGRELLTLYAMEAFLTRVAKTPFTDKLVLKMAC